MLLTTLHAGADAGKTRTDTSKGTHFGPNKAFHSERWDANAMLCCGVLCCVCVVLCCVVLCCVVYMCCVVLSEWCWRGVVLSECCWRGARCGGTFTVILHTRLKHSLYMQTALDGCWILFVTRGTHTQWGTHTHAPFSLWQCHTPYFITAIHAHMNVNTWRRVQGEH